MEVIHHVIGFLPPIFLGMEFPETTLVKMLMTADGFIAVLPTLSWIMMDYHGIEWNIITTRKNHPTQKVFDGCHNHS